VLLIGNNKSKTLIDFIEKEPQRKSAGARGGGLAYQYSSAASILTIFRENLKRYLSPSSKNDKAARPPQET
jgi:hypothetical protein